MRRSLSNQLIIAACLCVAILPSSFAGSDAVKTFKRMWKASGEDAEKLISALNTLKGEDDSKAVKAVLDYGFHKANSYRVQDAAFEVLRKMHGPKAKKFVLGKALKTKNAEHKVVLTRVISNYPSAEAVPALVALLEDKANSVQITAADCLPRFKDKACISALVQCLANAKGTLKKACEDSLQLLTGHNEVGFANWKQWWDSEKDSFDFSKVNVVEKSTTTVKRGKVSTTSDGSGIYETIVSDKVLFIVDVSGSMRIPVDTRDGKKMTRLDYVKQELISAIENQLTKDTMFNIIAFSSDVHPWKKKLVKGSKGSKKSAIKFIKSLKHDGMTNIYGALRLGFSDMNVDTVYFLTDGTPSHGPILSPGQILGHVRGWNRTRNIKVNTIAFLTGNGNKMGIVEDKAGSKAFMRSLAKGNNGSYRAME